jgi:pyrimidine-specific ribonucleoside hydrolase
MPRLFFLLVLPMFLLPCLSQPLPASVKLTVVIDTDCGIDDMRAISLLLAAKDINISAILLSDGSLPPGEGYEKIRQLLHRFGKDAIPLGKGKADSKIDPPWREFNRQITWGNLPEFNNDFPEKGANKEFTEIANHTADEFIMICLGPLTNLAEALRSDTVLARKIDRVIWYNESTSPMEGFNYECDKKAADDVMNAKLKIIMISNLHKPGMLFDTIIYKTSCASLTTLANCFAAVHTQPEVMKRLKQGHFRLADELVSIYLLNPELFDININPGNIRVRNNTDYNTEAVREALGDMITGDYSRSQNVVFANFPDNRRAFQYDVRQIMDSAIARYGYDEWKADIMTDEFHGHLGVFSIVGAKMGIKAREIFGVGPDLLRVTTYAGLKPPYSCLNDGIQVSTGATLGMGTISVSDDSIKSPMAVFTYKNRSIRITLKPEYLREVNKDINEGIVKFGLMDDGYWKLVRRNALKYWLDWDRNIIFTIEEI